jgi:glycine/D-amino acid oxidase-like deaminating enzyme
MPQQIDYLIVGQGLAGTILAHELDTRGVSFHIVHNPTGTSASAVAAGIYNPITGMRFVKTWLADEIFGQIPNYYSALEAKLGGSFHQQLPIFRPAENPKQQNEIIEKCSQPSFENYAQYTKNPSQTLLLQQQHFGGMLIGQSGWVNVPKLLQLSQQYFESKQQITYQHLNYDELHVSNQKVQYQGVTYKKIIFCQGYEALANPYFSWLPFKAVKGEILKINGELGLHSLAFLKGVFLLPYAQNHYYLGATYNWANLQPTTSHEASSELTQKLTKMYNGRYCIVDHQAGIRPATTDRRPFIGLHGYYPSLAVFNGFGTKAVSLAPYFAQNFADFLQAKAELLPDVNINRFSSLYLKSEI